MKIGEQTLPQIQIYCHENAALAVFRSQDLATGPDLGSCGPLIFDTLLSSIGFLILSSEFGDISVDLQLTKWIYKNSNFTSFHLVLSSLIFSDLHLSP